VNAIHARSQLRYSPMCQLILKTQKSL
jgi:hypothetical protein